MTVLEPLPDAETILKRLNHSVKSGVCGDAAKFGNAVYSVHFEEGSTVADKLKEKRGSEAAGGSPTTIQLQDLPPFGNQYNFHLEGVVDCPGMLAKYSHRLEDFILRYFTVASNGAWSMLKTLLFGFGAPLSQHFISIVFYFCYKKLNLYSKKTALHDVKI